MLMVAGACLSSLRDYLGFVSPTTGWHPWLMDFMPSALLGRKPISLIAQTPCFQWQTTFAGTVLS